MDLMDILQPKNPPEPQNARAEAAALPEDNHIEHILDMVKPSPVAGGNAVSAAEDSLSAAGESPAFSRWATEQFGDVMPVDLDRLCWAFTNGRISSVLQLAALVGE